MPRASIKANAKESLRGNWGTAILVLLLNWMLLSAATGVMVIGKLIIMGTLETGVALIYLKLSYREPAEIGDLFQPFQNFVNTFFAGFLSTIFTFLWSLLFVIPGIVKALAYSQVYYILCDHPEYTGREAIDASQEMMRGHKRELFVLQLSFFGWFLLSFLTFGLLLLYVKPYYQAALTEFYRYLKETQGQQDWQPQQPEGEVEQNRKVNYDPEQFA